MSRIELIKLAIKIAGLDIFSASKLSDNCLKNLVENV